MLLGFFGGGGGVMIMTLCAVDFLLVDFVFREVYSIIVTYKIPKTLNHHFVNLMFSTNVKNISVFLPYCL